jgi:hypothetical protein
MSEPAKHAKASIIAAIDAATGCQQCGAPLSASPSGDFCGPACQQAWHSARSNPLEWHVEAGHNFRGDAMRWSPEGGTREGDLRPEAVPRPAPRYIYTLPSSIAQLEEVWARAMGAFTFPPGCPVVVVQDEAAQLFSHHREGYAEWLEGRRNRNTGPARNTHD